MTVVEQPSAGTNGHVVEAKSCGAVTAAERLFRIGVIYAMPFALETMLKVESKTG